jgi:hypothetical protein
MENIGKTAADRIRDAEDVVTGIRVQGPEVAKALAEVLFEDDDARKLTVAEVVGLLGSALERTCDAYKSADAAHMAETSSDGLARGVRDDAALALRDGMLATESVVRGAFGDSAVASMGLAVTWAARPDLLLGQARNASVLVRGAQVSRPIATGVRIDKAALADEIEAKCAALDAAIAEVKREERAAQATYQTRESAAREWERRYAAVAETFTGLCLLAGHDELAARVKPTARRSSKSDPAIEPASPVTEHPAPHA